MKKLILHIGQPKTATSAIQNHFSANASELQRHGVMYPKSFRQGAAHHPIAAALLPPKSHPSWVRKINPDRVSKKLIEEAEEENCEQILISSEIFYGLTEASDVKSLFSHFDVSVKVLLRRQDLWLDSMLQHQLKTLNTSAKPETWLEHRLNQKKIVNYNFELHLWEDVFGIERVSIDTFEKGRLEEGLNKMFSSLCELPTVGLEMATANERLTRDALSLLAYLYKIKNHEASAVLKLRRPLEDYSVANPDPPEWRYLFSPIQRKKIIDDCQRSNETLNARYFHDERTSLFLDHEIDQSFEKYPGINDLRGSKLLAFLRDRDTNPQLLKDIECFIREKNFAV